MQSDNHVTVIVLVTKSFKDGLIMCPFNILHIKEVHKTSFISIKINDFFFKISDTLKKPVKQKKGIVFMKPEH